MQLQLECAARFYEHGARVFDRLNIRESYLMDKIETLVKLISEARRVNAEEHSRHNIPEGRLRRIDEILDDSLRLVFDCSKIDPYLERAENAIRMFRSVFPESSEVFLLRAPGRVNLIGEHTDYNGLPVLPIAVNRDIMLVAAPRSDANVCIHNMSPRFQRRKFGISEKIEPYAQGDWGNYAKAAAQAVHGLISERTSGPIKGFNAVVDGNIPMASGLSSSSALVVAFGIAMLLANGHDIDRLMVAETLADGEHYVGTRGGGMDQIICLMAQEHCAAKIDFFPAHVEQVPIPSGCSFVVCHSGVDAPKTTTARSAYNLRAAESHIAAAMMGATLSRRSSSPGLQIRRIGDLYSNSLNLSEAEITTLMEDTFTKETYSTADVARSLGVGEEQASRQYLSAVEEKDYRSPDGLKLRRRSRHVISEGRRVRQSADALRDGRLDEFGKLMDESHRSCACDYEISTPELDTLVSVMKDAGALGARLTGAGFGGCALGLVRDGDVGGFVEAVRRNYCSDYTTTKSLRIRLRDRSDNIFVCKAVRGAGVLFG